jgi:TrpR family trp operon transcriptional repressor
MTTPEKSGWKSFLKLCTKIKSVDELDELFRLMLTIEEQETIASRYLIIKALLEAKAPQREISENLKVSIAQITRGSNALKIITPKFKSTLKELI